MKKKNYTYAEIRKDIKEIPTDRDPWLTQEREKLLKECDETEKISAESKKLLSKANRLLAKYR